MRRMYSQKQLEKIVDNVIDEKDIAPVSGTSDGTNWTSLTVGDETHGFAAGGGAEKIVYVDSSTTVEELAAIITANKIPVYVYTTSNGKLFLPCVSAANSIYKFAAIDNENLWYVYYNQSWSSMSYYPLSNWAELGWVTLSSTSAQVWDCVQNYTLPILHANNNRDLYFYTYRSDASASGSFVFTRIKDNVCETYTLLNDVWTYSSYSVSGTNDGTNWTSITIGSDTYGVGSVTPANYVTTDTEQTITGKKYFNTSNSGGIGKGDIFLGRPFGAGVQLHGQGAESSAGSFFINLGQNYTYYFDQYGFYIEGSPLPSVGKEDNRVFIYATGVNTSSITPSTNGKDIGSSSKKWRDLYLSRNITNGTKSVSLDDLYALITYAKAQGWIS